MRQSELARRVGISASYLNLIEHNRRRIGGKILNKLAEELGVETSLLAEGAEAALVAGLEEAAAGFEGTLAPGAEFAARFPGWAQLLDGLNRQNTTLEQSVRTLTDRLAHDPHLAASLHDVISTVTAIRSTASILVETKELEPEWQGRFHRNINEESRRLAEGAQNLVRYLEAAPEKGNEINLPQDELQAFLSDNGYHFPALEGMASAGTVDVVLEGADALVSEDARQLARDVLQQYLTDAERLPLSRVKRALDQEGMNPEALAQVLDVEMAVVFRRLASLPEAEVGPVGLAVCDGSGALVYHRPLPEFAMPRVTGACTLWPLYQVLAQPQVPVRSVLRQAGRHAQVVEAMAVSEQISPASFSQPVLIRAHMLILPGAAGAVTGPVRDVGVSCRICPLQDCVARREPSVIEKGF